VEHCNDIHSNIVALCESLDRLGFEEWFTANRESLTLEFVPTEDEAEITVLAMKKYRQLQKVLCY